MWRYWQVCSLLGVPQTPGGVPQHQGGVELELVVIIEGGAAPSRVRDDHSVGQSC